MTVRDGLIDTLKRAGLKVDATNTTRLYVDGVVYVLTEVAEITQPLRYQVVAAVNIGRDIDSLLARCIAALAADPRWLPIDSSIAYGDEPVAGRDMPDGDVARITVITTTVFGSG